jgi:oligosaccharyltransferase complex subunit beta
MIICSFSLPSLKVRKLYAAISMQSSFNQLIIPLGLGPALTPKLILDFMNKEGNVLLALSGKSPTPSAISSLLLELDIHLPPDRISTVVDHFNYDTISATERHDVLLAPRPGSLRRDVRSFFSGNGILAVPKAVGQMLGNASSLIAPIIRAPETAYSVHVQDDALSEVEESVATGTQLALISALQARNSARFTVLGSVGVLEDKWFSAKVKGPNGQKQSSTVNREFAKQLSAWTFHETGVLKVGKIEHYLNGKDGVIIGDVNPKIYRIKNDVVCIDFLLPTLCASA